MKRSLLGAAVVVVALAAGIAHARSVPPSPGAPAESVADDKERQPHMRAAIAALRTAKDQLEKASADKGGHRKAAIDLVNKAIDEVQAGIDADNQNGKDGPKR